MQDLRKPAIASTARRAHAVIWFLAAAVPSTALASGTELIDVNIFGQPGIACDSYLPRTSVDGQFIAFMSRCGNLVSGVSAGSMRIYLRDMTLGSTILVSRDATGGIPVTDDAMLGSISDDGRFVLFDSIGMLTSTAPTAGVRAVYLFDRVAGTVDLVSIAGSGAGAAGYVITTSAPCMTPDGRYVLFHSEQSLSGNGGPAGWSRVYRRDRGAQLTIQVSPSTSTTNVGAFTAGGILANGSQVLYLNHGGIGSFATSGVFIRNVAQGSSIPISVDASQQLINVGAIFGLDWTPDGMRVVFGIQNGVQSLGDFDFSKDIYLADRSSGSVQLQVVSLAQSGVESPYDAVEPSISNDGRYVSFMGPGSSYVPWDRDSSTIDAFVRDLATQRNAIANVSTSGSQATGGVLGCQISGDGRYVVFSYKGTGLAPETTAVHLYRRDRIGFTSLGYGKPGTGQTIPTLSGSGSTASGGSGQIELSGANPLAAMALFMAIDRSYTSPAKGPFSGTVLVTANPFLVLTATTDGAGALTLPYTLPQGLPLFPEVYLQAAIADPLAQGGVAMSSALLMGM